MALWSGLLTAMPPLGGKSLWGQELVSTQSLLPMPSGLFSVYLGAQNSLPKEPQDCSLRQCRNLMVGHAAGAWRGPRGSCLVGVMVDRAWKYRLCWRHTWCEDLSGVVRAGVERGGRQTLVGTGLDMGLVYVVVVVVWCPPFSHW